MADLNASQVEAALRRLGLYRVRRAQQVAKEGPPDGISGATLLALGLRESGLRNINGGLKKDSEGRWIADPERPDHGVFQINRGFHASALKRMPAVEEDSWWPVISDKTAYDKGYAPRFEESLRFVLELAHEHQAYGESQGIIEDDLGRFAIVAHNAGAGGAMRGWNEGEPDKFTAGGDYSAWVLRHRDKINHFLKANPKWQA